MDFEAAERDGGGGAASGENYASFTEADARSAAQVTGAPCRRRQSGQSQEHPPARRGNELMVVKDLRDLRK